MEESFAPEDVIDKKALKALSGRSDAKGLIQIFGHGAVLTVTTLAVATASGSLWVIPAMLAQGIVLVFLFAALHETIHRTAFRSRRLNDVLAWICGALLVLPPEYFRAFHFAHHRFTQDRERDPELATPKPDNHARYFWYVSGLPFWRERLTTTLRHALGHVDAAFITARATPEIVGEARQFVGLYGLIALVSLAAGSWAAVIYWIVPILLGQPALRLFLLPEHTGCPMVPDMLRNSRTTQTLWPLRALAWNMPYHVEHHAYPALPFHALPKAHDLIRDRIAAHGSDVGSGYIAVNRAIFAALGHG